MLRSARLAVRQESGPSGSPPTGLSGTVAHVTRSGSDKPLKEEGMSTNHSGPRGLIRQGDVLLIPVDPELVDGAAPANRRVQERVAGRVVLAEGEATGHAHAILDGHARVEVQNFGEYH